MVVVVVMLLFPPLTVLASSWSTRSVATLLAATVPPFSGQRWRCGFVLNVRLLQDGWRAELGWFAQRLGGLVVP